jgi:hypothetical protein
MPRNSGHPAHSQGQDLGIAIAKRSSHRKATVAMARKLAVIMHAMRVDGTFVESETRSVSRN